MVRATDEERVDARAVELPAESVLERFDPGEFTQLLNATRTGDRASWGFLLQLVYADLRKLARHHVMSVADASTLGATGLVNECYLRLVGPGRATIENRRHFLNLASRVMPRPPGVTCAITIVGSCRSCCAWMPNGTAIPMS